MATKKTRRTLDRNLRIKILKPRARRKDTDCARRFAKYRNGMTVSAWLKATKSLKGSVSNVLKDYDRGNIELIQ